MGFWDDYNKAAKEKNYTGETVGQARESFWTKTVPGVAGAVATGIGESLYKPIEVMGKGLGNAIGEFSGANQQIQDATNKTVQSNNETINLLRGKLQKETDETKKKALQTSIDSINKNTADMLASTSAHFKEAKAATDPGHIANNAAQLALNLTTAGTLSKSILGAKAAGTAIEAGLQTSKASKIAQILKAITSPTTVKEGMLAGAGIGALQGGLTSGDTPGATPESIAQGVVSGTGFGAAGGALAGWLGGRGVRATAKLATNKTDAELSAMDAGAAKIAEQMDLEKVAQNTAKAASEVTNTPVAQVINASDDVAKNIPSMNPFDQPQMTAQQLEQAATSPVPGQAPQSAVTNIAENVTPAPVSTINPDELSSAATNSFLNAPEGKLAKPNRLQGEGLSYSEAETGLSKTGKDLQGRIVFGKDDNGNVVLKDGRHLLEAYREKGIQVPEGKIKLEGDLTMADVAPSYKTMAAEITPGQTNELTANITLTDKQVQDAVATMGDLKPKQKIQALKEIGATDEQMRNAIGVDSQGTKLKPMEVVESPATKKALQETPLSFNTTAEEIANGTPTDIGIKKISTNVADWLDKNAPNAKQTFSQKVNKAVGSTTDTITRMTETLGSFGADIAKKMVKAQKVASDLKATLRPNLQAIQKQAKEIAGMTQPERVAFGAKLNAALEDRATGAAAFTTQKEKDLYNNVVTVLDTIKAEMVKNGMEVRDNYTPHQMLKDFGSGADYLKSSLTNTKTRIESGHALPRRADDLGELNNSNILDLLPNYANGMVDHLAFSPVKQAWEAGIDSVPASLRRNATDFNDGVNYANRTLQQAINRGSSTIAEKAVQKLGNAYYTNALYMNPKNAVYSQLQKLQAMADTSHEGRAIANGLSKETKLEIRKNLWFGEATQSQDVAAGMSEAKSNVGKFLKKVDINRIGEASAVNQPFQWGFVDSLKDSSIYKSAIKAGKSTDDAVRLAMKDTNVLKEAESAGNMLINNTMFGANSIARPELLRGGGVLKKAFGMFQRFPLAESNFVKKIFTSKDTRVLEVLQSTDPRKIAIGENRMAYNTLYTRLKEARNGVAAAEKAGRAIADAPKLSDLDEQIAITKDAINKIDKVLKEGSKISGPKRAAAMTAMWVGSGAVATMFNGALNYGKTNQKEKTFLENLVNQDPTILSKVAPWMPYSVAQSGLTSPLIPFNKYGVNASGALNLVPGGGIVNRVTGGGMGETLNNMLKGK